MRRLMCGLVLACLVATGCSATPSITSTQRAAEAPPTAPVAGAPAVTPSESAAPSLPDISRDQAIADLIEVAFLRFDDAACVIDGIYDGAGVYDFTSPVALEQADQAGLMSACQGGPVPAAPTSEPVAQANRVPADALPDDALPDEPPQDESPQDESEASVDEAAVEESTDETTAVAVAPPAVAAAQPPAFVAGGITTGTVEIAGADLGYAVITPQGFVPGASAPVLIALPTEGTLSAASEDTAAYFVNAAVARGWVVVGPASTDSDPRAIAELAAWIETWVTVEGKPHLGGAGDGGTAAFSIAAQNPSAFQSLMIYPGLAPSPVEASAPALAQLPIRMWAFNTEGNKFMASGIAAENAIRAVGGNITLFSFSLDEIVNLQPGIQGNLIMNELQALR